MLPERLWSDTRVRLTAALQLADRSQKGCERTSAANAGRSRKFERVLYIHDMIVKSVHYPRSTVYEGVGLALRVFANTMTCKATHVVLVDEVGGFHDIDVFVGVDRG